MSRQTWCETLISAETDGTALTASTTPTSILPAAAKLTLPANFLDIGRELRITASGRISNVVTTPGTLTLDVRFGSVVAANGGAMALNTVAKTNLPWMLEWYLTCRSIGASTSATMFHQGKWISESVIATPLPAAGGTGMFLIPATAPSVGTGFDSTAAFVIDLFATWSINNANSIQVHQYRVESLN